MELEKTILRKVGEAIGKYKMIREGDRVAVGLSGGKDSVSLLLALLALQKKAPINFTVSAFTVEQGKFLAPIQPLGEHLRDTLGVSWTYVKDEASLQLLEDQPDHGCDLCSRYRRRAVYEVARDLGCNVVALGHTADDFCEALLRNALFNGRLSALPPVTWSRDREFRLIRPLVFVPETLTRQYAGQLALDVIPCGCSQKTGTVRRSLRDIFRELEAEHPHIQDNLLGAMGNIQTERLLDSRYLDLDGSSEPRAELFPVLTQL